MSDTHAYPHIRCPYDADNLWSSAASRYNNGMIIVVGAGLAGLTCAKLLHQQGRQVLVVDAGDGPGGRVRTRLHPDGFLLDRGFQVLFTAYPAARRHLSYTRLDLREFDPGAIIVTEKGTYSLGDPFKHPAPTAAGARLPGLPPGR